jgi:hypothetical protein
MYLLTYPAPTKEMLQFCNLWQFFYQWWPLCWAVWPCCSSFEVRVSILIFFYAGVKGLLCRASQVFTPVCLGYHPHSQGFKPGKPLVLVPYPTSWTLWICVLICSQGFKHGNPLALVHPRWQGLRPQKPHCVPYPRYWTLKICWWFIYVQIALTQ